MQGPQVGKPLHALQIHGRVVCQGVTGLHACHRGQLPAVGHARLLLFLVSFPVVVISPSTELYHRSADQDLHGELPSKESSVTMLVHTFLVAVILSAGFAHCATPTANADNHWTSGLLQRRHAIIGRLRERVARSHLSRRASAPACPFGEPPSTLLVGGSAVYPDANDNASHACFI